MFAAVDVHYPPSGGARAALVAASDAAFSSITCEKTVFVAEVAAYQPGEDRPQRWKFSLIERAGLDDVGLLVIDGYVDLDPAGRPGLGAHVHEEFGIPVIGVAKTRFASATHAVPVLRGNAARPLYVTAAGLPAADAAELIRAMAGKFRLPGALRRVDALARGRRSASAASLAVEGPKALSVGCVQMLTSYNGSGCTW